MESEVLRGGAGVRSVTGESARFEREREREREWRRSWNLSAQGPKEYI